MRSTNPMGGLFDNNEFKDSMDAMEFDPELSPTFDLELSNPSSPEDHIMADWQTNESFQDLSSLLDDGLMQSSYESDCHGDVDLIAQALGLDTSDTYPTDDLVTPEDLEVDALSSVILETIGSLSDADSLAAMSPLSVVGSEDDVFKVPATPPMDKVIDHDHSDYTMKQVVEAKPHETEKQALRRVKNNAASKVCRKQRRNKFKENSLVVGDLVAKNTELRKKIAQMEDVVSVLKAHLVQSTCKR